MKTFAQLVLRLAAVSLMAFGAVACGSDVEVGDFAELGSINIALIAPGDAHDVAFVRHDVYLAEAVPDACDATVQALATSTVPLEDEYLPGWVANEAAGGDTHRFADSFFVLPPESYVVCANPLNGDGEPSEWCTTAAGQADVEAGITTEIALISQCRGTAQGGLDVVTMLNDPPEIVDLDIEPSKFITQCETATITAQAVDPNGDELAWTWVILTGPAGASVAGNDNIAVFTPGEVGAHSLGVYARDPHGGTVALVFPIHVSADDCGPVTVLEVDSFPASEMQLELIAPTGQVDFITLTGTSQWHVTFEGFLGGASDSDNDGLDQVSTELVELTLHGTGVSIGPVTVTLSLAQASLGEIEELNNLAPGVLDVEPFNGGRADSFFDVFVVVTLGDSITTRLHNLQPWRMSTVLLHKPPRDGETFTFPQGQWTSLYDENGNASGFGVGGSTNYTPGVP